MFFYLHIHPLLQHKFLCHIHYGVHLPYPFHRILGIQFLCNALHFFCLIDDSIKHILCLLINFRKISSQFSAGQQPVICNYYKDRFLPLMDQLNMKHTPHSCRYTCSSMMHKTEIRDSIRKKIMGHSQDLLNLYTAGYR